MMQFKVTQSLTLAILLGILLKVGETAAVARRQIAVDEVQKEESKLMYNSYMYTSVKMIQKYKSLTQYKQVFQGHCFLSWKLNYIFQIITIMCIQTFKSST